jgi:hypothetical protein
MTDLTQKAREFADTRMTDIRDWEESDIVEVMAAFAEHIRAEDRALIELIEQTTEFKRYLFDVSRPNEYEWSIHYHPGNALWYGTHIDGRRCRKNSAMEAHQALKNDGKELEAQNG